MYDLIIQNGRIIAPENDFDATADVAVYNGKIVGVGSYKGCESDRIIDATGCIVTPGLIDVHAHLWPLSKIGVSTECACLPSGVTTAVDAGSSGWATYEITRGFISTCKVRVKALVNVAPTGLSAFGAAENVDPDYLDGAYAREIERLFAHYSKELCGIKLRVSDDTIKDMGEYPLIKALELAERCHTNLVVHPSDSTVLTMARICSLLRKGDVLTHMYHKRGITNILNERGAVIPEAWEARRRGVLFDVGHARAHCDVLTAKKAIQQGFLPDMIGTDTDGEGVFREGMMFSMPFVLSRMLSYGMSLNDVIRATTSSAAAWLGLTGKIGCLSADADADISIFQVKEQTFSYHNRFSNTYYQGSQLLKPVATVKDGQVVYRDIEF